MYKDMVEYILRVEDGAHIPKTELNADYCEYLIWLENGGNNEL